MAFASASSQYLINSTTPITAVPLTMACWAYTLDNTPAGAVAMMAVVDTAASNYWQLRLAATTGVLQANSVAGGTLTSASATQPSQDTWYHAAGVYGGTSSRFAYLNGTKGSEDVTSSTPSGIDSVMVGAGHSTGAATRFWDGNLAHAALWDVALTDAEIATLADGISPLLVRPSSLVFYAPMFGNASPELDIVQSRSLTLTNTPTKATTSPRVFMPRPKRFIQVGLTAAAVSGTATASITEADVVTGGKTIIITLTGDTWVTAGATFDGQRSNIIQGLDSAQSEATGWNAEVRDKQGVSGVVRTSDTVVTITLDAQAAYNITATETITVTVPSTALTGGVALTASPTFTVTAAASGFLGTGILYSKALERPRLAA